MDNKGKRVFSREDKRHYSKDSRSGWRPSLSRLEVRVCGGGLLFSQDSARLMGLKLSLRPFLSTGPGEEDFLHSVAFSLDSSWLFLCIRSGTERDASPLGRASPFSPISVVDSGREVSAEAG